MFGPSKRGARSHSHRLLRQRQTLTPLPPPADRRGGQREGKDGIQFSQTDQSGNTTYYDYDGDALIGEQAGGTVSTGYTGYYAGVDGYTGSAGAGAGGSATYYQYDPQGDLRSAIAIRARCSGTSQNGYDQWGNPQEGPAGYSAPPAPFRQDGAYRDPSTGYYANANAGMGANYSPNIADEADDTDQLMTAGSWGQMWGRAGSLGADKIKKSPAWQAGSPERRFESQTLGMLCFPYYAYTLATGNDPVAGRCLSKGERLFGGLMLALGAVTHFSPGAGGGAAAAGEAADDTIRLRHFTSNSARKAIADEGILRASDQDRIFAVRARGKPGSPRDVEQAFGIKPGRGNSYIEFDVSTSEFKIRRNPLTGAIEYVIKGDVPLDGRNPSFHVNR